MGATGQRGGATAGASRAKPARAKPARAPSGAARPARTPSRDVEAALIDAAERVLVRDGPEAVTVRAVAVEAGVAPMGVYNRFGGKDGLVDELLKRGFTGLRDALLPRGEIDAGERLFGAGLRYRDFALGNRAHYLAMFDDAIHQDVTAPEVMLIARASFDELVGHVTYGMGMGALAGGDPDEVAQQIWSTVHGAVQLEIKGMLLVPDAEQNYRELLGMLLRGLRP